MEGKRASVRAESAAGDVGECVRDIVVELAPLPVACEIDRENEGVVVSGGSKVVRSSVATDDDQSRQWVVLDAIHTLV